MIPKSSSEASNPKMKSPPDTNSGLDAIASKTKEVGDALSKACLLCGYVSGFQPLARTGWRM